MAQDGRQGDEVVLIVREEPLGHRVAEQVRIDLHSDDRGVFVADRPHALLGQAATAPNENLLAGTTFTLSRPIVPDACGGSSPFFLSSP